MGVKMKKILLSLSILLYSWSSFGQPAYTPPEVETPQRPEVSSNTRTNDNSRNTQNARSGNSPSPQQNNSSSPYAATLRRGQRDEKERKNRRIPPSNRGKEDEDYIEKLSIKKSSSNKTSKNKINRGSPATGYNDGANFYYSFSGADCDVYAFRGGEGGLKHLDSIATVSVSIYEAKAPVRALGHASPVGFSGNIRSIAGSIICILQDEHPLLPLMNKEYDKHLDDDINTKVAGRIFPFNLMLMYKNEVGNGLSMQIDNIEIISEGIVTSVNDLATEMVFQFVATEMHQLKVTSDLKVSKRV